MPQQHQSQNRRKVNKRVNSIKLSIRSNERKKNNYANVAFQLMTAPENREREVEKETHKHTYYGKRIHEKASAEKI